MLRCRSFVPPGLRHGFSLRAAPDGSPFDLGPGGPVAAEVGERRRRFAAAVGLAAAPAFPHQVHGTTIVDAGSCTPRTEADGVVCARDSGSAAGIRTADCVPLLVASGDGRWAAAVHAGWRGTAAGIAGIAVEALGARGVAPRSLSVAIGPAVGGCCYLVGAEAATAVARASPGAPAGIPEPDGVRIDLAAANRAQLLAAGVPPGSVHVAGLCTVCRGDLFFSHRREAAAAGRMAAVIGAGGPVP